jgi:hypothetical protein
VNPDTSELNERLRTNHLRMERLIGELPRNPSTRREPASSHTELVCPDQTSKFSLRKIVDPNDPAVNALYLFMKNVFVKESETLTWLIHSIKDELNDYYIIESKGGQVLAFSNSQYITLSPKTAHLAESIVVIWHVTTEANYRKRGFATEIYYSIYRDALATAQSRGHLIKGIVGEAIGEIEIFLNKMGRKRLYFEEAGGDVYEVPYICPPLDFNPQTGELIGDAIPEHVMLRLVNDDRILDTEQILRMVDGMYREYLGEVGDYRSTVAYENAERQICALLDALKFELSRAKDRRVFAMSKIERDRKREHLTWQGKRLVENT